MPNISARAEMGVCILMLFLYTKCVMPVNVIRIRLLFLHLRKMFDQYQIQFISNCPYVYPFLYYFIL